MVTTRYRLQTNQARTDSLNKQVVLIAKPGGVSTGVGRYVHMLNNGLYEAGIHTMRISPILPPLSGTGYELLRRAGADLRTFLTNYPIWANYPQANIYHLTSQNLATLLLFHRPKGKVVVTVHDIIPFMQRNNSKLNTYRTIVDRIFDYLAMVGLRRADHLIAVSHYTKQCVIKHLGIAPEAITVAHLGIDHERFRPLLIPEKIYERFGLPDGRRYLIYVGSEDPRKNLETLVRALARLRVQLPDVELIKVGRAHFDGERQRLINLAIQLGVRNVIHFLDDVVDDELPLLYNLAKLCVTPSLYEGFGFPVLEAMACGTPVVCAKVESLSEVSSNAGLFYEHKSGAVENLADAMMRILVDHNLARSMRERGQTHAATFRWSNTIQQTHQIYRAITTYW